MTSQISCVDLVRIFSAQGIEVQALQGLNLEIEAGELTAIVGASGSGKSTLLTILSGLDSPTAGSAMVDGHDLLAIRGHERTQYRRETVGFVFQQTERNLLPFLSAAENISMALAVARSPRALRAARVDAMLDVLGLTSLRDRKPSELSGGQRQRVAIAVGLANAPRVLLADEPTGELDEQASVQILELLREINERLGVTVLIVTHDEAVSDHVRRTIQIRDGRTSTEVHRSVSTDHEGVQQHIAREYAVLDRVGRLQLPQEYLTQLALQKLVRLELETDHVQVHPTGENEGEPMTGERPVLRGEGLTKTYGSAANEVHALTDVSVELHAGELVILRGPSGSGKTTLLNIVGGLDVPTSGRVWLRDVELTATRESDLVELRRRELGFVFQSFALLPMLTAAENIEIPLRLVGTPVAERAGRVQELLESVGLSKHAAQRPDELSGGQRQRVGIARALANRPAVLIADEPTGQLDSRTAAAMMDLIASLVHEHSVAAIVTTHDPRLLGRADRLLEIADGRLAGAALTSRKLLRARASRDVSSRA